MSSRRDGIPELQRTCILMFLKEIIEMSHLIKAKRISNLGYIPGCMMQQHFSFLQDPFWYDLGGGFPGGLFHDPVQMIDMHIELFGKFWSGTQVDGMMRLIDRELALKQLKSKPLEALE